MSRITSFVVEFRGDPYHGAHAKLIQQMKDAFLNDREFPCIRNGIGTTDIIERMVEDLDDSGFTTRFYFRGGREEEVKTSIP